MKKKKIKNLTLNKKSISDLQANSVKGEGTLCLTEICIPITVASVLISCLNYCSNGCNKPTIP